MQEARKQHTAPRRKRATTVALILIGILVIVAALGAVSSVNHVCASCHAMRPYAHALADSPHTGTSCYACHLPAGAWSLPDAKIAELSHMYPAALLGRSVTGAGDRVSRAACLRCHTAVLKGIVSAHGIRIRHDTCAVGEACDACHGAVAHGAVTRWVRQPVMERCVQCHREKDAPVMCDSCHAPHSKLQRLRKGPWQVTHGPTWKTTHGVADLEYCATCHPKDYCARCHGVDLPHPADFGRTHGDAAVKAGQDCYACHDRQRFCLACHQGFSMPHPTGFLARHSKVARSMADKRCLACHERGSCDYCHVKHTHPGRAPKGFYPAKPTTSGLPKASDL